MDMMERLAKERRARLAAERLLEWKSRELFAANEKLSLQARGLSEQVIEERQSAHAARSEAERLKGQNLRYLGDLDRAHTAAVMAERRLRESIDTIRDGFAVFDAEGRMLLANRAFLRPFPAGAVAPGLAYGDLLALVAPLLVLGAEPPGDWAQRMLARLEAEPIPPVELAFHSGLWVRLEDRRAKDGDLVSVAIDITAEMRLRAAIEAIPDGFVIFDREDRLLLCNQRYRDIYAGAASAIAPGARFEEILRAGVAAGQHVDALGREEAWLAERLAEHRAAQGRQEERLSDGRWISAHDRVTPDGGRVGLRVDVTAQKAAQAALEAARAEAEAASRAKSAFLANMSHEIRTPMNGVVGMAELLCDSGLTGEQRLFAETIRSSGEALLVIINDILDYSKIEAGRLVLHPEPFDLERVIHETVMLLQPRAREKGIDLMIDFDMFLPTRFVGDPGRLRQVLTNLLGNAVKFTEAGHVLVRVVGIEADAGRQRLHITVEDTGIGIAPEFLDHIFGEFNQVEYATNRRFEGTGLGLAITRRLVERMEGAVWVDSEPGRGSCFGFRLVLPVAEEAVAPRLPTSLRRVLVVDGSFINRTILERQLAPCGIAVTACRSAAEALAAVETGAVFDLVLADHDLPEMDGVALARALRAGGAGAPVVLMSSQPSAVQAALAAGVLTAVVQKPLLRADLYRRLAELTGAVVPLPPGAEPGLAQARRAMRVLAAEDNRTNQLVFAKMVRACGIELVFADNGRQAVDLWRSFRPDLIFMDISMPEMDGREAARAIRAEEAGLARVPILALTAHAMEGDAEGILAAGIDRHLTKPLRKSVITEALAEFCPPEAVLGGVGETAGDGAIGDASANAVGSAA
jgi:signal transduction histidine kinase/DNA-binding response OmpR family regulator